MAVQFSRADGTEKGKDAFVGNLPKITLEVGCILCAVWYGIVLKDGILQVVELVEKGVEELGRMGDTTYHHDGHTCPGCCEDEGFIGTVDGVVGAVDFRLRTPELTEDGRELGEVGRDGIVVSEDAPVTVDVEIVA